MEITFTGAQEVARLPQHLATLSKPKLDKNLRQHIAELLLAGHPQDQVVEHLKGLGFGHAIARSEVNKALSSPYLSAGKLYADRAKKRTWHLDVLAKVWRIRKQSKGVMVIDADKLNPEAFFENFYGANVPLLIRDMAAHWPALRKWSLDYFEQTLGNAKVEVQFDRDRNSDYEINKDAHRKVMAFHEYIALLRKDEETNNYYLTASNTDTNTAALAPLWKDISPFAGYLTPEPTAGYLWLGPKGTLTPFHHDLTNNLLVQVSGRKHVVLAPGFEVDRMRNSQHCFSDWSVDPKAAFSAPEGQRPTMLECVIGAGDALFLPVGWWHFVKGVDMSFSMSFTNFVVDNDFYSDYSTYGQV